MRIETTRLVIEGLIQGVGFRPFIKRLAENMQLRGRIFNSHRGVIIDLQAPEEKVDTFINHIRNNHPVTARISAIHSDKLAEAYQYPGFAIDASDSHWHASDIPPDRATCDACLTDLQCASSLYYQFPFVSCADCGPRFSIIQAMPYDRAHTTMHMFALCSRCHNVFATGQDRRFHTEALSCAHCGPSLQLRTACDKRIDTDAIFTELANRLRAGQIVAIKGIGGFQLCCNAGDGDAIARLRQRKQRPAKPFALMMKDQIHVQQYVTPTQYQLAQLQSPAAPIVLIEKSRFHHPLAACVAPGVSDIGVMLAYSPLHFLLLEAFAAPLVMTSGNATGQPLCTDNALALGQLARIADCFLLHDRQIAHRIDDSVVKVIAQHPRLLRRARGYVPAAISLPAQLPPDRVVLAMGADMKNTVALTSSDTAILSGHNGTLNNLHCLTQTRQEIDQLSALFTLTPELIAIDKHPDYLSSQLGRRLASERQLDIIEVQHHHAHLVACLVENNIYPTTPILGIALDGLGYGDDGTLWGGELLLMDYREYRRLGSLQPYCLLGGDKASLQPWRNMVSLAHAAGALSHPVIQRVCQRHVPTRQRAQLAAILEQPALCARTTSAGRLFDAVACLLDVAPTTLSYEGEAALKLEALAYQACPPFAPSLPSAPTTIIETHEQLWIDYAPLLHVLLTGMERNVERAQLAWWFHHSFVESWVALVDRACQRGLYRGSEIALSGGVFQNALILEPMLKKLAVRGFTVYSNSKVPANDGGIALGQCAIALSQRDIPPCV